MRNRFRLLGIKTGHIPNSTKENPVKDFIKVLNENTYYPFYSCYSLETKTDTLKYYPSLDVDLYNNDPTSKVNIQISAIVGKNGCGKSTLLELLYLANYNLGCHCRLLEEWQSTGDPIFDKDCKKTYVGDYILCKPLPLYFEIFFEKENKINKLKFNNESIKLFVEESRNDDIVNFNDEVEYRDTLDQLTDLFYSIAINYSIYGLNSKTLGKWVVPLFHKNDGYKTPLVINPKRDDGNFDINEEMEFANYRLVSNLLIQKKELIDKNKAEQVFVTDKQFVKNIRFRLDETKVKKARIEDRGIYIRGDKDAIRLLLELYAEFYEEIEQLEVRLNVLPFKDPIQNYIVQKANKILRTYTEYTTNYLIDSPAGYLFDWNKIDDFVKALNDDKSHVTFKLKQALNYLRNCIYIQDKIKENNGPSELYLKWDEQKKADWFEFTLEELLNTMHTTEVEEIIRNIPPSIFEIQIELSQTEKKPSEQLVLFSDLSSGEQQLIHSVNTVLYHLNNLNSVHASGDGRLAFKDVNIVFDEIELYFHPEYQRRFVSYLLDSINRLPFSDGEKGVKNLNILFSTHSPFILSDIPNQNILMLEVEKESGFSVVKKSLEQTFGGNIHDLLANSFFLEKGYVGEKAVEIINDAIKKINKWTDEPKYRNQVNEIEKDYVKKVIRLIGNELVKGKLVEMYLDCFNESDFREKLASEYELIAKKLRGHD